MEFLYATADTKPARITVDGAPAICPGLDCGFTYTTDTRNSYWWGLLLDHECTMTMTVQGVNLPVWGETSDCGTTVYDESVWECGDPEEYLIILDGGRQRCDFDVIIES